MKEELLKEAMELAQKYRDSLEKFAEEKAKEDASVKRAEDIFIDSVRYSWMLVGFCRALFKIGVFDDKDMEEIWNLAIHEFDSASAPEANLSPNIKNFIKGLKGLDNI